MQTNNKQKLSEAASLVARSIGERVDDQIDFAVDLLRVTNMALRGTEFADEGDFAALAAMTGIAVGIIRAARRTMDEQGRARA